MCDFLTGTKRPPAGTPVLSAQEVLSRLKTLNRTTALWTIVDGALEGVNLEHFEKTRLRENLVPLRVTILAH